MKVKQRLLYPVSMKDFLPAVIWWLREQADKPPYCTIQNVTCQRRFAKYAEQRGSPFGKSPTLSFPNSGPCLAVQSSHRLGGKASWLSSLLTIPQEACGGGKRAGIFSRTLDPSRQPEGWRFGAITPLAACQTHSTTAGDLISYLKNERRTHL
jgi:hypothetical protein